MAEVVDLSSHISRIEPNDDGDINVYFSELYVGGNTKVSDTDIERALRRYFANKCYGVDASKIIYGHEYRRDENNNSYRVTTVDHIHVVYGNIPGCVVSASDPND